MLSYENERDLDKVIQFSLNKKFPKRTPLGQGWNWGKRAGSTTKHILDHNFGENNGHLDEINSSAGTLFSEKPYNKPPKKGAYDQGNYIGFSAHPEFDVSQYLTDN